MKATPVEGPPEITRTSQYAEAAAEFLSDLQNQPGQWFRADDLPGAGNTANRARRLKDALTALGATALVKDGKVYAKWERT